MLKREMYQKCLRSLVDVRMFYKYFSILYNTSLALNSNLSLNYIVIPLQLCMC